MTEEETRSPKHKTPWIQWVLATGLLALGGQQLVAGILRHYQSKAEVKAGAAASAKPKTSKIRREGSEQYLWAKGSKDPKDESSEWFDMTGSPVKLKEVQYGIGKDTIPSIDNPVFVDPDDPALLKRWHAQDATDLSKLRVIGYAHNGDVRAYPIKLLDRHELVNDTVGGKPVTVGW